MDIKEIMNEMCDLFLELFNIMLHVILPKCKRACPSAVASIAPKLHQLRNPHVIQDQWTE